MSWRKPVTRRFHYKRNKRKRDKTEDYARDVIAVKRDMRLDEFRLYFKAAKSSAQRLKLLQEMAELQFIIIATKLRPFIRKEFDENKRKWFNLKGKCAVCSERADVRHHVIQIQNGGLNLSKNIVLLCNRCHAEVHPWLKT